MKLDQAHLETVIPQFGRQLLIVNGAYRGCKATLESLNADKFAVTVIIDEGPARGRKVQDIRYEDVCKLHSGTDS